jgi:hypothetical protein
MSHVVTLKPSSLLCFFFGHDWFPPEPDAVLDDSTWTYDLWLRWRYCTRCQESPYRGLEEQAERFAKHEVPEDGS